MKISDLPERKELLISSYPMIIDINLESSYNLVTDIIID